MMENSSEGGGAADMENYEAELENIGVNRGEARENEPSRPTSAPPTLDISNQNLFAFQPSIQGFQGGEEDTFPSPNEYVSPVVSPSSSASAFTQGVPSQFNKNRDPRKRTQSIENFLAQSPGSILAPRKHYGAQGAVGPGQKLQQSRGSDDPMQYINTESPGHSLMGLRKRLDTLNLSTNLGEDSMMYGGQNESYQTNYTGKDESSTPKSATSLPSPSSLGQQQPISPSGENVQQGFQETSDNYG
mmetsp:Transcript_17467/g.28229  ORF Transcript_17467/g.28229 Transcript_17467/m.28229 type:complete len:245 (-) Transcript_17467:10-744(-)